MEGLGGGRGGGSLQTLGEEGGGGAGGLVGRGISMTDSGVRFANAGPEGKPATFRWLGVLQQGQRHQSALSGPRNLNWPAEPSTFSSVSES